jgi:hypothetical protein
VNGHVLLFTASVALVTGIVTSLVPALQSSKPDLTSALKAGSREGSGAEVEHSHGAARRAGRVGDHAAHGLGAFHSQSCATSVLSTSAST